MNIIHTVAELRAQVACAKAAGKQVGLVPTMGALHEGHASLIRRSVEECGCTVVSVFVNPTQFNDPNDLKNYPRTLEADCVLIEALGADIVFAPTAEEMYPEPDTRVFAYPPIDSVMEGGMKMMAFIAFVMLVAAGYGSILRESGAVSELVSTVAGIAGGKLGGAVLMLLVGLLVTMGIGTSFGTIPIIAAIYCPLALELGFSTPAIILLIGIAAALGDAGSPASDSTLAPTAGLNMDTQHDHIWDTCVPTFIFYSTPLLIFGVAGAMIL